MQPSPRLRSRVRALTGVAVVGTLLLAACSSSDDAAPATSPAPTTAAPDTTAPPETTEAPDTTAPPEATAPPDTTAAPETTAPPAPACPDRSGPGLPAGETVATIEVDGREREYAVYVPEGVDADSPTPLVFNLHGRGSDRVQQAIYGGFQPLADRDGILLVHPQGITPEGQGAQQWNFAGLLDDSYSDEAFIVAILDELAERTCVDRSRVYATGMSSGGFMSSALACLRGDVFAAVAPVAGSIFPGDACAASPAVPFMTFHGTDDATVGFEQFGIAGIAADWAAHNGCGTEPAEEQIGNVTVVRYPCEVDAETVLYVAEGGGHSWPGSPFDIASLGPVNRDIDATELIWEFFASHERQPG